MVALVVEVIGVITILRYLFQVHLDYSQIFTVIRDYILEWLLSDSFELDYAVYIGHDIVFDGLYILVMLEENAVVLLELLKHGVVE